MFPSAAIFRPLANVVHRATRRLRRVVIRITFARAIALDPFDPNAHADCEPSARYDTKRDSFPYKNALGSRH